MKLPREGALLSALLSVASVATAVWLVYQIGWGVALEWDELEYAYATNAVAQGRLPFRDFWEHHAPLQWLLMAPLSGLAPREGVGHVLALRWMQLPLWGVGLSALLMLMRDAGIGRTARWGAMLLALASPVFAFKALEYRVDTVSTTFALVGLAAAARPQPSRGWSVLAGAMLVLSALANLRVIPALGVAGACLLFWDPATKRWALPRGRLWIVAGALGTAAVFASAAGFAGLLKLSWTYLIEQNRWGDSVLEDNEAPLPFLRFLMYGATRELDIAEVALVLLGALGGIAALRRARRPQADVIVAVVLLVDLAFVYRMKVRYLYHLQLALLMMVPLAARTFEAIASALRSPWIRRVALGVAGALGVLVLVQDVVAAWWLDTSRSLRAQDTLVRTIDERTRSDETVWDGVGYAWNRRPAYVHWILPYLVRLMAQAHATVPYGLREISAKPPAAIVFSPRIANWLLADPEMLHYVVRHYLPWLRDLWVPGLSARTEAGAIHEAWVAPRTGTYRVVVSSELAEHPWFTQPLVCGRATGDLARALEFPVDAFAGGHASLTWRVGGSVAPAGGGSVSTLELEQGERVEVEGASEIPLAIMVVPGDAQRLFVAPPGGVVLDQFHLYGSPP